MSDKKIRLQAEQKKGSNSLFGCSPFLLIVAILFACFVLMQILMIVIEGRWFIPGDPRNFDPIANYAEVARYAGDDVHLVSITAEFVRRDGTMELDANYEPAPNVVYNFYRLTDGRNSAPPGVNNADAVAQQVVNVRITKPFNLLFIGSGNGIQLTPGMDRDIGSERIISVGEHVPAPTCSLRDLWTLAIEDADANPEAVAVIRYDINGYNFRINGTDINLRFNVNCELED